MSMERLKLVADQYERMVGDGTIQWRPVDKRTLDRSTIEYLETILEPSGLSYSIAEQRLQGTVLFKVHHPTICYLHHDPATQQHMWANEGFHEALPNNAVLASLAGMAGVELPHRTMVGIFDDLNVLTKG